MMKKMKRILVMLCSALLVSNAFVSYASAAGPANSELEGYDEEAFEELVEIVVDLNDSGKDEEEVFDTLEEITSNEGRSRAIGSSISNIWNSLTDSEKKLLIRYPFDALKVNTAKNIATSQTEIKFGYNGLGDRSDAFRHGIWNAEMTILIGETKAELFATAHEDVDTEGYESDGFPKTNHRDMDLHNNAVGRGIGKNNLNASETEMADIIYSNIYSEASAFVWLHE